MGVSHLLATLLANRGFLTPAAARAFLDHSPGTDTDPFLLDGMDRAVTRLLAAWQAGERVCVYGDYDVDGLTATAVLVTVLEAVGLDVTWRLPRRDGEGYGLHAAALDLLKHEGVGLVVTVDCGITAVQEARQARAAGLGLIITDHHEPGPELPLAADAVINPRLPASGYPWDDLAGVGVAFKLAQAFLSFSGRADVDALLDDLLDLVALGTVADVVPLQGENRHWVSRGLAKLDPPGRPGLGALRAVAGIGSGPLTTYHLAFQFAPRLNAAGRLGDPERGLRLLLSKNRAEADPLAEELDQENRRRQAVEEDILEQIRRRLEVDREIDLERERAIVLADRDWHQGVIGIVASRVVERFRRPALLMAVHDGVARGSGRSVPSFNLAEALDDLQGYLARHGGHRMAAGFEIAEAEIAPFRERFLELARDRLSNEDLVSDRFIDAEVDPDALVSNPGDLVADVARLEPCGTGNPEAVLCLRGVRLVGPRRVGRDGRHLKASVRLGRSLVDSIGFGLGDQVGPALTDGPVDVAFRPEWDEWKGSRRLQLNLVDLVSAPPARRGSGGKQ